MAKKKKPTVFTDTNPAGRKYKDKPKPRGGTPQGVSVQPKRRKVAKSRPQRKTGGTILTGQAGRAESAVRKRKRKNREALDRAIDSTHYNRGR